MTDPIAAPPVEPTPASPTPVPLTPEIEKLIAAKAQELSDQRFSGYQSAIDKKFSALTADLKKVQQATLSPAEIEDDRQADLQQQLAKAQRETALLRASLKYPAAFPVFEQLIAAEDPEAQLEALTRFLQPAPPAVPPPAVVPEPPAPRTPPVDPNNPPRTPESAVNQLVRGEEVPVTQSMIDQVLGMARWPGR